MIALLLAALAAPDRPNVLLIVLDDVGVDAVSTYEGQACTPSLDRLAASGVKFTRAYAMPACSPTRAALMSGRRCYRTGVGTAVLPKNPDGLDQSEWTLLEHFSSVGGYTVSCAGKWHVGDLGVELDPNVQGCSDYRGSLTGGLPSYYSWKRTVNGLTFPSFEYVTRRTAMDAAEQMMAMPEPWFSYVSFNSAHRPFHPAPAPVCEPSDGGEAEDFRSMVENVDAYVGALVDLAVQLSDSDVIVMVYGDNGTPAGVDAPCPAGMKGTVFEGGIHVPLLVYAPGVLPLESSAMVSAVDFFATLCDLADLPIPATAQDSSSFAPALQGLPVQRTAAYCEWFSPNGGSPGAWGLQQEWRRALVEPRWKLMRNTGGNGSFPGEAFFDLHTDPCEAADLLQVTLTPEQAANYNRLGDLLDLIEGDA